MRTLERVVAEIAPTHVPVVLVGDSGTGKEALALQIHRLSRQRDRALVKCSCISPFAELASLSRDAENDGDDANDGSAGTVFLDEINQLDAADQARLLRLLPDGEQTSAKPRLRARVISATTRSLEEETHAGRFHQGLCYRLSGVSLRLPALRDRKEDIPDLFQLFVLRYALLFGRREPRLGSPIMDLLVAHSWPGNIRELENVARKMVVLGDEQLALTDLAAAAPSLPVAPPAGRSEPNEHRYRGPSLKQVSREASRKAERNLIRDALERTHWNRKRTARELQISYKALLYKLKQLGLTATVASGASFEDVP